MLKNLGKFSQFGCTEYKDIYYVINNYYSIYLLFKSINTFTILKHIIDN